MTDGQKEDIKGRITEYLDMITTHKGKQYICPLCGSGTGKSKTPAGSVKNNKYSCFACNKYSLDTFDLISIRENIDLPAAFIRAAEIFSIAPDTNRSPSEARKHIRAITSNTSDKALVDRLQASQHDYTEYIKQCSQNITSEAIKYLQMRGLSDDLINAFKIGYDSSKKQIIIPYNKECSYYIGRSLTGEKQGRYFKPGSDEAGAEPIFNLQAIYSEGKTVFVTEGQIDALSIIEAGGEAVALGSTGHNKLIKQHQAKRITKTLILSLDKDEAGIKATLALEKELSNTDIKYIISDICGQLKDPNEALTADRDIFIQAVGKAIKEGESLKMTQATHNTQDVQDVQAVQDTQAALEEYKKNNASNYIREFWNQVSEFAETPEIATGFKALDEALDGGLYEGLYIIGAISSLGKTTFILQAADQMAQQGNDVLIYSLEMARTELIAKSISRLTYIERNGNNEIAKTIRGITNGKRYAQYSTKEIDHIQNCVKIYSVFSEKLYISEGMGDIGAGQIKEDVKLHVKLTGRKPVVIIDYLQILKPDDTRKTDKQNTDKAVFELKRLSREYKIPIIAISSLNRENYTEKINMTAFKESGAIEYSSDVLIGLQCKVEKMSEEVIEAEKIKTERPIELIVLKNRNGAAYAKINYTFYAKYNYFHEEGKEPYATFRNSIKKDKRL